MYKYIHACSRGRFYVDLSRVNIYIGVTIVYECASNENERLCGHFLRYFQNCEGM